MDRKTYNMSTFDDLVMEVEILKNVIAEQETQINQLQDIIASRDTLIRWFREDLAERDAEILRLKARCDTIS